MARNWIPTFVGMTEFWKWKENNKGLRLAVEARTGVLVVIAKMRNTPTIFITLTFIIRRNPIECIN
jgi:hypothetical protein